MIQAKEKKSIFTRVTGERKDYTMENRMFTFVVVISFCIITCYLCFDLFIGQLLMSGVIIVLLAILSLLYYFSRFRKQFNTGIIVYAICCYLSLSLNYFNNGGIVGPTLFVFCLTFHMLIAMSPIRLYRVWIFFHLSFAFGLLACEYLHPDWVPQTYPNRLVHFLDVTFTYLSVIVFIYFITDCLRQYYVEEKQLAEDMAKEILVQNEKILAQNKQLERVNEEKNKMFSIVSHDLRGPIESIKGYLELITQHDIAPETKAELEGELLTQTRYTSDLLMNLLYWSKAQMNGVNVKLVPLLLMEMVDDARNYKIATAAKKGIKLTYSISKELEVIADKDMLNIVLRNLVNNAIKFTPSGGEISIKVAKRGDMAEIAICDNGIGIPNEKQKYIFTAQSGSTYGTQDEKGIGLGLMLCKDFVEMQNGKIWFKSESGKGSEFYISLPLARL